MKCHLLVFGNNYGETPIEQSHLFIWSRPSFILSHFWMHIDQFPSVQINKAMIMMMAHSPGGVLPMWWVIHMCRGFDPLFSLWQDRARSFWGIFLIHQQQSYLLGYKNYQFLQKSIFLAPNSIFSSIFLGPIFSGQRHTPISFQAEYPPPGLTVACHCFYYHFRVSIAPPPSLYKYLYKEGGGAMETRKW